MSKDTYNYKRKAISAAKHLEYPETVLLRLKSATTDAEIERIMVQARKNFA